MMAAVATTDPSAVPAAPATASGPAALPAIGKTAEAKGAEQTPQPQNATEPESDIDTGIKSKPAATDLPAPTVAISAEAGEDGEQPGGQRLSPQLLRHTGGLPQNNAGTDPLTRAQDFSSSGAPLEQRTDPATKPDADTSARPERTSTASVRLQPDFDSGGSSTPRGPETALQNPGLTGHANQAAVLHVTAAVTNAAIAAAPTPQPPTASIPLAGLAVEIVTAAHAGKQRFEIRLDPPELGRIDVRLDVDRDGNVTSRMTVERADTLDLLRRDAAQIERALQQAGLKTSDNALEFSLRQEAFTRDERAADGTRLIVSDDEPPALEAARGYGRILGLGGGLDIRV
jgi:flagellar hook-length control protein FliK